MSEQHVYFLVLPDTLLLDVAGMAEAFREASAFGSTVEFRLHFVGLGDEARSSVGLVLAGLEPLPSTLVSDAWLVLLGRTDSRAKQDDPVTSDAAAWVGIQAARGHRICCVCAGALIAARAGLLDGRACTTHHALCELLAALAPRARVQRDRIFVEDGPILTSAGVTAGVDLALYLISQRVGPAVAQQVARELVVYARRAGSDPQISVWMAHRNHLHPVVHRVQDAIQQKPLDDWSVETMARAGYTSVRSLTRLFRQHADITPLGFLHAIRLELAREHMATTSWGIERIAASAGFNSAHQLRRILRKAETTRAS